MTAKKRMPPRPNVTTPGRRTNALRRYINKFYFTCLLNTLAALVFAIIYTETRNEAMFAALCICEGNALLTWALAD